MLDKIKLKVETQLEICSEIAHDLNREPDYMCPKIDKILKDWKYLVNHANKCERSLKYELDNSELKDTTLEIINNVSSIDLEESLENIRDEATELREYGNNWRSLAERIIKENEELLKLLEEVSNKYLLGIE